MIMAMDRSSGGRASSSSPICSSGRGRINAMRLPNAKAAPIASTSSASRFSPKIITRDRTHHLSGIGHWLYWRCFTAPLGPAFAGLGIASVAAAPFFRRFPLVARFCVCFARLGPAFAAQLVGDRRRAQLREPQRGKAHQLAVLGWTCAKTARNPRW